MVSHMDRKMSLLIEDNPNHEALILWALRTNHIGSDLAVVHNGRGPGPYRPILNESAW